MSEERDQIEDFVAGILRATVVELEISGKIRQDFFRVLRDEVSVANCFTSWNHGVFSTFEQMLMGCIIQLVKEKNHYKKAVEEKALNAPYFMHSDQEDPNDPT